MEEMRKKTLDELDVLMAGLSQEWARRIYGTTATMRLKMH